MYSPLSADQAFRVAHYSNTQFILLYICWQVEELIPPV